MSDIPRIPAEAKEIIKNKRTGKIYESKAAFDADVADPMDARPRRPHNLPSSPQPS